MQGLPTRKEDPNSDIVITELGLHPLHYYRDKKEDGTESEYNIEIPRRKAVACFLVTAGMCSPSRCPAMNVCSDFTIQAFGRHVTILAQKIRIL